jgi:malate dehydrogenase (oxaloacetate-decarboxylating)(NADP+)
MDVLKDPFRNKSCAFSMKEREELGLTGLVPAGAPRTQAQGVELAMAGLRRIGDDLAKYEYLLGLLDRDARLFFAALAAHTAEIVPLVYTPVVGRACLEWHKILAPARGLYISLNDAGRVRDVLRAWPSAGVRAIVVTDGGRSECGCCCGGGVGVVSSAHQMGGA